MHAIVTTPSTTAPRSVESRMGLEDLFQSQAPEHFRPGRTLFWEGDPADHVFQLVEGMVRLYRIMADGRRVIVGFMFAGELLGLSFQDRYLYAAEAITDVSVRRVTTPGFRAEVDRSPELRPKLLARLQDEMCAAQDQMLLLLHHSADQRVAAFLLMVGRKTLGELSRGSLIKLDLTRADIADYLSLTIETVSRCISRLRNSGVIALDGPVRLTILKPTSLKEVAGEEEYWLATPDMPRQLSA